MFKKLLTAVALLALGGEANAQRPPATTSTPYRFGGFHSGNGAYNTRNMFGGYNYRRR